MSIAGALIFIAVIAVFFLFNLLTWKAMTSFHPRWRKLIVAVFIISNLLWPLLPFVLRARTNPLLRLLRATLAPPWFFWLMFVIVYAAVLALIALAWLPFRRRSTFTEFGRRPSAAFLIFALLFCILGFYHATVPLRIESPVVVDARLPAALEGTRIVLLSDLHVGLFTRTSRLEQIAARVNELRPDLVAVSGDMIDDDPHWIPKMLHGFRRVEAPVVAVLGNHEIYGDPNGVIAALKGSSFRLLVNEGYTLERGGSSLWIAGISDYAAAEQKLKDLEPDLDRAMKEMPPGSFPIALAHQPRVFEEAIARDIPLSLAGHTHGGQCGIPSLGISLAGLFLEYHMGLYREGRSQLYINTGTGYWVVPLRFGMTPEITSMTLRSR